MGKASVSCFEMLSNYDEQSDAMSILPFAFVKSFSEKQKKASTITVLRFTRHNCALFESKLKTIPSAIQKLNKNKCSM